MSPLQLITAAGLGFKATSLSCTPAQTTVGPTQTAAYTYN